MKIRLTLLLITFVFSFGFTQEKVRLLMVGNSFTFYYNLPMTIEQFSKSKGLNWEVHQSTSGGASFKDHWNSEKGLSSVQKIKNNTYKITYKSRHTFFSMPIISTIKHVFLS